MKIRYSKNAMKFLNKLDNRSVLSIVAGIEEIGRASCRERV